MSAGSRQAKPKLSRWAAGTRAVIAWIRAGVTRDSPNAFAVSLPRRVSRTGDSVSRIVAMTLLT